MESCSEDLLLYPRQPCLMTQRMSVSCESVERKGHMVLLGIEESLRLSRAELNATCFYFQIHFGEIHMQK